MKQISLYLLVALSIAGCGGGSPNKKLTEAQKQELASVVNATARTGIVSKNYADKVSNVRGTNVSLSSLLFGQLPGFSASTASSMLRGEQSPSLNFKTNEKTKQNNSGSNGAGATSGHTLGSDDRLSPMEDSLQGNCEGNSVQPSNSLFSFKSEQDAPRYKVDVFGQNCPIDFHFNLQAAATKSSLNITMSVDYAVKDQEFRTLNDVDAFKLTANVKGSGNPSSAKFTAAIDGFVNSQTEGRVDLNVRGSMTKGASGSQTDLTITLKMKDFTAQIRTIAKTDASGMSSTVYTLNGEKMTQQQMEQLFSDGVVLGQEAGNGGLGNSGYGQGYSQGDDHGDDQGDGQVKFPNNKR